MTKGEASSKYEYLLENREFKRWFLNVKRGSEVTAFDWLRRVGYVCQKFGKTPTEIASLSVKDAGNFLLDIISSLEEEHKSGGYIANCVKPLKSWLDFNGIVVQQKIKIAGRSELVKVADERPPTPEELAKILSAADLKAKAACSLVAFAGLRPEVLGDFVGKDGLKIQDIPELTIKHQEIMFEHVPAIINVRPTLSKTGNRFSTFLCAEACESLKQYLEWRMRRGERLSPQSPIITPLRRTLAGEHIRTTNISDMIRDAIRAAGFSWRPYVLRRYFDTRLMIAESDGLLIRDYRTFWMGHRGDIEHTYTVNKGLSKDVVEKMRESYGKAAERHLQTTRAELGEDKIRHAFKRELLAVAGYTEQEITKFDLTRISDEELHHAVKRKLLGTTSSISRQKVVSSSEIGKFLEEGWEYVAPLSRDKAIVKTSAS